MASSGSVSDSGAGVGGLEGMNSSDGPVLPPGEPLPSSSLSGSDEGWSAGTTVVFGMGEPVATATMNHLSHHMVSSKLTAVIVQLIQQVGTSFKHSLETSSDV
jgi:hypothetical protein